MFAVFDTAIVVVGITVLLVTFVFLLPMRLQGLAAVVNSLSPVTCHRERRAEIFQLSADASSVSSLAKCLHSRVFCTTDPVYL